MINMQNVRFNDIKYNNFIDRKNHVNFQGKTDVFVKKAIPEQKGFIAKLKSFFNRPSKEIVERAKRAGLSIEEYSRNCEIICPKQFRDGSRYSNYIPVCITNFDNPNQGLEDMLQRLEGYKSKNINIFKPDDEKQLKRMIADTKNKLSNNEKVSEEELDMLDEFWHSKVLYLYT